MANFIIAYHLEYNCYDYFRYVNSATGAVYNIKALDLLKSMTDPAIRLKFENLVVDWERDSFKFVNCDSSYMCILDKQGQPKVNRDGLIVVGIDGDYVFITNYEGKIMRLHMLQVSNNVLNRKFYLCNAVVLPNKRIMFKTDNI